LYFTQLIYIKPGQEKVFDEFESYAIPAIAKYDGKLLFRIRPDKNAMIESTMESPYEIHFVQFDSENDFEAFKLDKDRVKYLHLKEQSIREAWIIKGIKL
jgi:antibiotic biosynthesis monooxygenase (ABM) superfamily enzyme